MATKFLNRYGTGLNEVEYHNTQYLPLTGGTVSGQVTLQQGTTVHSANGTSGTSGYIKLISVKITTSYQNVPIIFEIAQRGKYPTAILYLYFANADSKDPAGYLRYTGYDCNAYLYKSATSTWDIYIQKSESYDDIAVIRYHKPQYMSDTKVTFTNVMAKSLPSGATKATLTGRIATADAWTTARTITLGGDLSGSVSINGSANVTLTATVKDDSHNHTIANIDNLQTTLNGKLGKSANAVSASKWATARTITLGGDCSGSVSFDGSANVTLTATVKDDSHSHTIANIDNLQNSLNTKLATSSANYVKTLSISGRNITVTKGDGSTSTLTTQDTNTTYSTFKAATSSAAGGSGLVPAPAAGNANRYLRSDATWQVPPNTTYSTGTATKSGLTKLYTSTGTSTDGTMTRAAITSALNGKLNSNANAVSATKLATARTISLTGDVTGSASFDGTANISISTTVSGGKITCDTALSSTSTNPVQNKVIYAKIQELETRITTAQNTANAAKTVTDKYQTLLNIIGNNQ